MGKEPNTITKSDLNYFQDQLLCWYSENGRNFLWRKKSATNFEMIIAEVFLQRTKADTVNRFLPSFFKKYSSWKKLGDANESELKEFIRPLGLYNQRGSRLYKLAQELKRRNGRFPKERNLVEEIPMMGQYITNAFELYVLKKRMPLIDVNMTRVLERLFGKREMADIRYDKHLQEIAYKIVNHEKAKELNWAILDFAALVCKVKPNCIDCLIQMECRYFKFYSPK
jgi:A/G-specific adenine glycosylase